MTDLQFRNYGLSKYSHTKSMPYESVLVWSWLWYTQILQIQNSTFPSHKTFYVFRTPSKSLEKYINSPSMKDSVSHKMVLYVLIWLVLIRPAYKLPAVLTLNYILEKWVIPVQWLARTPSQLHYIPHESLRREKGRHSNSRKI